MVKYWACNQKLAGLIPGEWGWRVGEGGGGGGGGQGLFVS